MKPNEWYSREWVSHVSIAPFPRWARVLRYSFWWLVVYSLCHGVSVSRMWRQVKDIWQFDATEESPRA